MDGDLVDNLRTCSKTVLATRASTGGLQRLPSSTSNLQKKIALIMLLHYAPVARLPQGVDAWKDRNQIQLKVSKILGAIPRITLRSSHARDRDPLEACKFNNSRLSWLS